MKNQERFDRSVAILLKAYLNDTLYAFDCHACAVGNLVAGNMGFKIVESRSHEEFDEDLYNWIDKSGKKVRPCWGAYTGTTLIWARNLGTEQEKSTGYSKSEINRIEAAFMLGISLNSYVEDSKDTNFARLMNTIDCLMEIDEVSVESVENAKALFPAEL